MCEYLILCNLNKYSVFSLSLCISFFTTKLIAFSIFLCLLFYNQKLYFFSLFIFSPHLQPKPFLFLFISSPLQPKTLLFLFVSILCLPKPPKNHFFFLCVSSQLVFHLLCVSSFYPLAFSLLLTLSDFKVFLAVLFPKTKLLNLSLSISHSLSHSISLSLSLSQAVSFVTFFLCSPTYSLSHAMVM